MYKYINKLIKEERAAAVLEYAIVFPIVMFAVIFLFFIGYAEYQKAVLESAVQRGATKAVRLIADPHYSKIYNNEEIDVSNLDLSKSKLGDNKPYRYIFGGLGNMLENQADNVSVKNDVRKYIKGFALFGDKEDASTINVDVETKNYFVYQTVTIRASQVYKVPIAFGSFNPQVLKIEAQAVSAVSDPDEFIRNADMAVDMAVAIGEKTGITAKITPVFSKVKEFADKLFSK